MIAEIVMARISGVVLAFKRTNVAAIQEVPENIKKGNRDGIEALCSRNGVVRRPAWIWVRLSNMRREKIKYTQGFFVRNPAIAMEMQTQMGIRLQRLFAETVRQPVPARLTRLLDRLKLADRLDGAGPDSSKS
jgi:hypothetical protein